MLEAGGSACQVIADGTFFKEREGAAHVQYVAEKEDPWYTIVHTPTLSGY